jgi:hypothetical protein
MGAVFYFFIFLFYGTLTIPEIVGLQSSFQIASIEDIPLIITWRSGKPGIKELSAEYISTHIREFVFYLIDEQKVWLMRLFVPSSCPEVIEMGSFVKLIEKEGICTTMTHEVERIGESLRKTVIAITQPKSLEGKELATHLERMKWESCTEYKRYTTRMKESPWKIVWQKSPQRFEPDSEHIYL